MGDGHKKVYITEDKNGTLQVFDNFEFAIDTRHTYALLIGNSEFDGNFQAIPPVRNNLVDLYNLLTDKRHIGLPRQNVIVIWNKNDNEIQEMMLKMSRIPDMETFLLYYSGHGHKADRESLVLTARNTRKFDEDIIGGVDFNFITEKVLKRSTAKQKILILDACHSGLAAQGEFDPVKNFDVKGTYILTSSGDEASYFEKNARHTFFTGTLLSLLNEGINDESKEMLSLDDIYTLSYQKLVADKFPEPHFKNQLNIAASAFLFARNPRFSVERLKQIPEELMAEGREEEAFEKYKQLVRRFPDDHELRRKKDACDDAIRFNELVHTGDALLHGKNDYAGAIEKYKQALQLKKDDLVITKIKKCKQLLEGIQAPPLIIESAIASVPLSLEPVPVVNTNETLGTVQQPPASTTPVVTTVNDKESYTFNDQAAIISYKDEIERKPLEIPFTKMIDFTYMKSSHTILVRFYDETNISREQKFIYPTKEQALQLKNFLLQKTGINKIISGKTTPLKELVLGIFIWLIICVVYIGIITWAKGVDQSNMKGLREIIIKILVFIGSILTPTVAIVLVSFTAIIAFISVIVEKRKNADEVYIR